MRQKGEYMRDESKERLSATLLQATQNTKSPFSVFGESLFKIGEVNQKIHDDIWNFDFKKERRLQEKLKFELQQELDRTRLEREQLQLGLDQQFSETDRKLSQQHTRAGIANTHENTRLTKHNREQSHFEHMVNMAERIIMEKGGVDSDEFIQYYNRVKDKDDPESKLWVTYFTQAIGKRRLESIGQERQFSEEELKALDFMGISKDSVSYNRGKWTGTTPQITAALNTLPFVANNLATLQGIRDGMIDPKDVGTDFEKAFKTYALTYRDIMKYDKQYQHHRNKLIDTHKKLAVVMSDFKKVKESIGPIDRAMYNVKSYAGGTTIGQDAFTALQKIFTAAQTKLYFGGNASNSDRKAIEDAIGRLTHNDRKVLHNFLLFIDVDLSAVEADIDGANPIVAYAKYGEEYSLLKNMHNMLKELLDADFNASKKSSGAEALKELKGGDTQQGERKNQGSSIAGPWRFGSN